MLKLKVTNQRIEITELTELGVMLVSGSSGEYECQFDFDESWNDFEKIAVFTSYSSCNCSEETTITKTTVIKDNKCIISESVLVEDSMLKIGVYGVNKEIKRPTIYSKGLRVKVGASPIDNVPDPPESIYLEIIKIMQETKEIAQSVRDDADAGKFNGKGVPAGGKKGQVLKKNSDEDFDSKWMDDTGVQSDWNQENPEEPDYIKNKIIPLENNDLIDDLIDNNLLLAVTDSIGILSDENNNIILW